VGKALTVLGEKLSWLKIRRESRLVQITALRMSDITIDDVDPLEPDARVHHIPFKIQHNGSAKISTFFLPKDTTATFEGTNPGHRFNCIFFFGN